jgi:glycosyltransferase involved in cell wall biosynthesis
VDQATRDNRQPKKELWRVTTPRIRMALRHWMGPFTLGRAVRCLHQVLNYIQPDLVHAMRIPYEGMISALSDPKAPLLVSIWGNDFTLHAPATPMMSRFTRLALKRASALHTDCHSDVKRAFAWGFPANRLAVVLPGAGGVQREIFYPESDASAHTPQTSPVIINPRGLRAYVRNDSFFRSIPLVLEHQPKARFVCPGMEGDPQAHRWVTDLGIAAQVELLPQQSRLQMAALFRQALVAVSPSSHDGTPNTLLEAMACGCFPVAGDLESLREWITPGVNGLLIDPSSPSNLASALQLALENPRLRARAGKHNARLITEWAEYHTVMKRAEDYYRRVLSYSM